MQNITEEDDEVLPPSPQNVNEHDYSLHRNAASLSQNRRITRQQRQEPQSEQQNTDHDYGIPQQEEAQAAAGTVQSEEAAGMLSANASTSEGKFKNILLFENSLIMC